MPGIIDLAFDLNDGVTYSAQECGSCGHTTPAGETCLECQPYPTSRRCLACKLWPKPIGGDPPPPPPPEGSQTIAPDGRNDQP